MRMIHAVRFHEKFVASGVYTHHLDYKPAEDIEQWSIHEQPDGSQMIRVDREIKFADEESNAHVVLLYEALRSPLESGGRFERVDAHCLYDFSPGKKGQIRLNCAFFDKQTIAQRRLDNEETQHQEFNFDENYPTFFWDSALLMGLSVIDAHKYGHDDNRYIPALGVGGTWIHLKAERLLNIAQPYLYTFGRRGKSSDMINIDDKIFVQQSYWLMVNYKGTEIIAWIDENDVLLKKVDGEFPEDFVILTQYARRPEPLTP